MMLSQSLLERRKSKGGTTTCWKPCHSFDISYPNRLWRALGVFDSSMLLMLMSDIAAHADEWKRRQREQRLPSEATLRIPAPKF